MADVREEKKRNTKATAICMAAVFDV